MTTKNPKLDQHLVIQFKELTDNFEEQASELILPARQLDVDERDRIVTELKATIQNISFMITSLSAAQIDE